MARRRRRPIWWLLLLLTILLLADPVYSLAESPWPWAPRPTQSDGSTVAAAPHREGRGDWLGGGAGPESKAWVLASWGHAPAPAAAMACVVCGVWCRGGRGQVPPADWRASIAMHAPARAKGSTRRGGGRRREEGGGGTRHARISRMMRLAHGRTTRLTHALLPFYTPHTTDQARSKERAAAVR